MSPITHIFSWKTGYFKSWKWRKENLRIKDSPFNLRYLWLFLKTRYYLLKGMRICCSKICYFGIGLFWAEGNWESTDPGKILCLYLICLKRRNKFSCEEDPPPPQPRREKRFIIEDGESTARRVCINRPYFKLKQTLTSIKVPPDIS